MLTTIKKNIILLLILLSAFFIRVYKISTTPALNPDEAALGYNAYSLILTGKDEHGVGFPLHFKSFGDYKPGAYVYLAIPFVKVLGLTPLAVRLPNLILSLLAIFFLYKLIHLVTQSSSLALVVATLLSISPWHIHFSRGAWESSTALSFIILGVYFFYRYLKKPRLHLALFSLFFFLLSTYIYHSARIFSPLLLFILFLQNKNSLFKKPKHLLIIIIFGALLSLPVTISFLNSGGTTRLGGVGITADPGPLSRSHELLNHHANTKLINRAMHNRRVLYLISWAEKYFSHFNLNFLFLNGDEVPRSKVPEMGQLYLLELPFLILGLYALLKKRQYRPLKQIILPWLLIAPLASSLTFQAPSALRSLPMTVPLVILTALGLKTALQKLKSNQFSLVGLILIYLFSFVYYLDAYFVHYPQRLPFAWQYGFQELSDFLDQYPYPDNRPIYITNKYDQPYILMLFFQKYPPAKIQPQIQLTPPDQYGFSTVTHFDKYYFQPIDWEKIPSGHLVVTSNEEVPIAPIRTIDFPNNSPAFKIYMKP